MEDLDHLNNQLPLIDAIDHEILMHREAHFGGQFSIMLDYYKQEGRGVRPEFSIERIEQLAKLESELKQNLAPLFLELSEIEKIGESRNIYKNLRSIYEIEQPKVKHPLLIADLILSEDEEAKSEVQAIVAEKDRIVPSLIEILKNELFYDPLFPGYGLTPDLVIQCLGLIGDKRAIITLFESFGQGDFFTDDQIIKALKAIGEPAKEFLIRVVKSHPINEDNERAAIALIHFKDQEEVAAICFDLLKNKEMQKDPCLLTYLTLICEGLKDPIKREEFRDLAKSGILPKLLTADLKAIIQEWESEK